MRFHCGISFSWRSIKRFLFPILLGLLAFFGFSYLFDNHESIPFGRILKVNALENYQTWYDYSYDSTLQFENQYLDSNNTTLKDMIIYFNNLTTYKDYTITITFNNDHNISKIIFYIYDNLGTYYFNLFGYSSQRFNYKFRGSDLFYYSYSLSSLSSNIYSESSISNFINCITDSTINSCSTNSNSSQNVSIGTPLTTIDNSSSNTIQLDFSNNDSYIYYSTRDLIINNTYNTTNSNTFYKSLRVNGESIEVGSKFLTFTDYVNSLPEPEPEPTPEPDDPTEDTTEHKPLFNKLYWFDDNSTEYGVLTSIYELLFLYCLTMIIFRILTYIKNTRW